MFESGNTRIVHLFRSYGMGSVTNDFPNESEIYSVTKYNNFFFYALIKNENGKIEYLEIMTNKEREKIDEYFLKMEEAG